LGFELFSPGIPTDFLREEYAGNLAPYKVLLVMKITSFLSSVRDWGFHSLMGGADTFLQSQ
jgi:hypothetical protein